MRRWVSPTAVLLTTTVCAADPPTAATKQLLVRLSHGSNEVVQLIEPNLGVWIVDGEKEHLHFRQTDQGLVLDAYAVFDEHQVGRRGMLDHSIAFALALARGWAAGCPAGGR
jgi:hypothetical protein